ncbi:type IV pilus assembly protein PilW [Persephonella hydrogeniphila]|uniref:Type IV pilus assembly protein PilW n=1 Tax=Persephonella hydrogeniphila TaxID=198703 RepID=A0A285NPW2_9AQUI|nr:prepilin-type N-terminal cleavage/methylation domain-containing protein [Persephonella hydrogeniphila]SNZ11570.1 type IV pilus assembly protein PilW [Persephonella hydrogeniphila]
MSDKKGYSIIELLITLIIVGLILSAAYYTYTEIFRSMKEESESVELQMEKVIGAELIRLDLEHMGYGIAYDATDSILNWDGNSLTIRSTLNNTNKDTYGWVLCNDGIMISDNRVKDNDKIVYIDVNTGNYTSAVTDATCPPTGIQLGLPFADNANACNVSGHNTCNTIIYRLSTSQSLTHCNPYTRNLLRVANAGTGSPVLNCVASINVTFDLDTDGDGTIDCNTTSSGCTMPTTNSDIREQVKRINFYILMQEGGLNKNYVYPNSSITVDGITFSLPTDYTHYRWKVIKISAKPRGMFGSIIVKTNP